MSKMPLFKNISFVGGGRVTYIFLHGLKRFGNYRPGLTVCDPDKETFENLKKVAIDNLTTSTDNLDASKAQVIILAIHPPQMDTILAELSDRIDKQAIVISLVPTKSISYISEKLSGFDRIVRMIPNAPSAINQGYNPVAFSTSFSNPEIEDLLLFLSVWGDAPVVDEKDLEAYAIITGMGPTYFWFQWQLMTQLASKFGLDNAGSTEAVYEMIRGSNELLYKSGFSTNEVTDLIPIHPLKESEKQISDIFNERLSGLYTKLTGATS